jgi:predicted ATPase
VLTRLRVQGFKNLLDVDVRFGPFTCILGPNGAGKSNLFDAIRFLSLLTKHSILEAVQLLRETKGRAPEPSTLFTRFEDYRASEIRLTAEMIIERAVQDDFGVPAEAAISTLRYEVAFRLGANGEAGRLELAEESLVPIRTSVAGKELGFTSSKGFRENALVGVRRGGPFISTLPDAAMTEIKVHQEGHGGRTVPAPKSSKTVLGGTNSSDFPTVLAVQREMESWHTLLLEPSAMRAPSYYSDPKQISAQGAHLPAAVNRLVKAAGERPLAELANRLAGLLDDVRELRVQDDERTETLTLLVRGRDGVFHPARSLSDGTLRFLVLATLGLDPDARGVLCLEEPENGIHPERIPAMVTLLKDIALDPMNALGPENPLRQVVVNTHSPPIVRAIEAEDVIYLEPVDLLLDGQHGRVAVARAAPGTWRSRLPGGVRPIPRGRLRPYLEDRQLSFSLCAER